MSRLIYVTILFYSGLVSKPIFLFNNVFYNLYIFIALCIILIIDIFIKNHFILKYYKWLPFYQIVNSLLIYFIFFFLGNFRKFLENFPKNNLEKTQSYIVTIKKRIYTNDKNSIFLAKIRKTKKDHKWRNSLENIKLFTFNNDKLNNNDILLIYGSPKSNNSKFSENCHYRDYIKKDSQQKFTKYSSYKYLGKQRLGFLENIKITLHSKIEKIYKTYIKNKQVFSIALSIFTGNRNYLSNEVKNLYINTGVYHVLAISGLHLGILIFIFSLLFSKILNFNRTASNILLNIICLSFAYFISFTPSIFRACLMFLMSNANILIKKSYNLLHNLFLVAYIILLINPSLYKNLGFILSFLSVLGILIFYRYINNIFSTNNKFFKYLWSITVVSISTQLLTAPISMFYFNKFPVFFIFSNWLMIPAAFIILFLCIAIIVLNFIPIASKIMSFLLTYIVLMVNNILQYIADIPFSNLSIKIEFIDVIFYYSFLIVLFSIFKFRKVIFIPIFCIFSLYISYVKYKKIKRNNFINCKNLNSKYND